MIEKKQIIEGIAAFFGAVIFSLLLKFNLPTTILFGIIAGIIATTTPEKEEKKNI
jgi:uncharacterized membrane protein YeaQ/YmgE (transglycosylase-associated protein family)